MAVIQYRVAELRRFIMKVYIVLAVMCVMFIVCGFNVRADVYGYEHNCFYGIRLSEVD